MNIVNTVGRGVAWNTVGTILGKIVIFANVFLMLTYLSVYYYGLAQLVLSVISTMGIFLLPGLSSTILADLVVERARKEFGKMKSLFLQFFWLNMVLAIIAWAVLFFGADIAAHWAGNDSIGTLLKIASFSLLATPLRTVSTLLASVELRFFDQTFYGNLEEIVKFICLVTFLLVMKIGVAGLLYAVVVSQFVTILLYLPRSLSAYMVFGTALAQDQHTFWRLLHRHRIWGIANSYIGTLSSTLNLWIIRFLLGTEAVGLFSFAVGIVSQAASFLPLGSVLAPLLPRYVDQPRDFARYLRSSIKAQGIVTLGLIVSTFIGLPILILIFPKYGPAASIIMIMIFSLIPNGVSNIYTPAFTALKKQYEFARSLVWKTLFVGVFTWVSILVFGLAGIGVGSVLAATATAIERTVRMQKILPELSFTTRDMLTFDELEKNIILSLCARVRGFLGRLSGV